MTVTVDRLEGGYAVLEDEAGGMTHVPLTELPCGTSEGDKLERTAAGWQPRPDAKAAALERNRRRLERLLGGEA